MQIVSGGTIPGGPDYPLVLVEGIKNQPAEPSLRLVDVALLVMS